MKVKKVCMILNILEEDLKNLNRDLEIFEAHNKDGENDRLIEGILKKRENILECIATLEILDVTV